MESSENYDLIQNSTPMSRLSGVVVLLVSAALVLLPLFLGAKLGVLTFLIQITVFVSSFLAGIYLLRSKCLMLDNGYLPRLKPFLFLGSCLSALVFVQIIPLPLCALHFLSPNAADSYEFSEIAFGFLTINFHKTWNCLWWLNCLLLCGGWLLFMPYTEALSIRGRQRRKNVHIENGYERSVTTDAISLRLENTIILSGLICALIAISHWVWRSDLYWGIFGAGRVSIGADRAHWPFVNPNHLAVFLEMAIILTVTRFLRVTQLLKLRSLIGSNNRQGIMLLQRPERFWRQMVLSLILLTMTLALLLTLSRAGIFLTALACFFLWIIYVRNPVKPLEQDFSPVRMRRKKTQLYLKKVAVFGVPVVIGIVVLFFLGRTGRELLTERIQYGLNDSYDEARAALALASLSILSAFPLFGVGLGNWELAVPSKIGNSLFGWKLDYAHNDLLQFMAETGLVGTLFMTVFFFLLILNLRKALSLSKFPTMRFELIGTASALFAVAIHSLVDFPFHIPALAFTIIVMTVIYLRRCFRIGALFISHFSQEKS